MAIEPIQQFQSPTNSLLQVLQGGNQAITGILDRAIQIGRDMSDKRTRQEQDMAGMRLAETNLAQRRGEELSQNIEDAQRFAQNAYQFEKNYAANREDRAAMEQRQSAQDVLQQSNADRNYGLSARNVAVSEGSAQRQADAAAAERARLEAERASAQNVLTPGAPAVATGAGPAVGPAPGMSTPEQLNAQGRTGREIAAPSVATVLTPPGTAPIETSTSNERDAIANELGRLGAQSEKAMTPDQRTAIGGKIKVLEERLKDFDKKSPDGLTPSQQLTQTRYEEGKQKEVASAASKEIEQLIKGDTTSFIPQGVVMTQQRENAAKNGATVKVPTDVEVEQAKAFDANRVESEIASAKGMSEPEYLAKGPQTPRAIAARKKVWNYANASATPTSTGAVSAIPGYKPTGIR